MMNLAFKSIEKNYGEFHVKKKTHYIQLEELTADAYKPFGYVIGIPTDPPLASDGERSFWAGPDLEIQDGAFMPVYVEVKMRDYIVRRMHRHRYFAQTLIPLGGKSLITVVAPPADEPSIESLRAFLIDGSNAIVTLPGVWHRNPAYPLASEASLILISRNVTTIAAAQESSAATIGGDTDRVDLTDLFNEEIRIRL
jgi:ureidoglycolate lyase